MAIPPNKKLLKPVPKSNGESMSLFKKRQQQRGVVWADVSWQHFMSLLHVCVREGIGLGIYPAAGGRGICIKLYTGKKTPDTEYASTAEEFDELVISVLDSLGELEEGVPEGDVAD